MTAVIYARYSSDNQREASIEGQLRDCKDYAEKNGITVVGTYIDRAYSAKTDDRPDFQRMIKDSAKKIFDVVLVWKLDRFARNRFDAVNYKYQLEKKQIAKAYYDLDAEVMVRISSSEKGKFGAFSHNLAPVSCPKAPNCHKRMWWKEDMLLENLQSVSAGAKR